MMTRTKHLAALLATGTACLALAAASPVAGQTSDMLIGQVFMGGWNFCPDGSTEADGKLLSTRTDTALFALFGITYGGDGANTFGVPDLRGRSPMGVGTGQGLTPKSLGQFGGAENFTLTIATMPTHTHAGLILAENTVAADSGNPQGNALARANDFVYSNNSPPSSSAALHPATLAISPSGQNQPVFTQSPYQVVTFCVVTAGIFPSSN